MVNVTVIFHRDPRGRSWDARACPWATLDPRDLQGSLMDHKNTRISTNIQRQELSIAVIEPTCWGPSHEALDGTIFLQKSHQNS